jgi:hypothetical protein
MRFESQLSRIYCQIFSTGLSSGHFGGSGIMVMLAGLIDEKDGVGVWCDRLGDFREVQVHRFGVAEGEDQSRALALFRADGTEDIGRCGSLIPRGARARAALGPPAGDLVLLADPCLVLT